MVEQSVFVVGMEVGSEESRGGESFFSRVARVLSVLGCVGGEERLYLRRVSGGRDLSRHLGDLSGVLGLGSVEDDSVFVV